MPDTPSITIVKTFTYRGQPEKWSNTYHFSGDTPANATDWKALADAIWAEERKVVVSDVKIAAAYGYAAGNENSVFQVDYTVPPNTQTLGVWTSTPADPGDVAVWVRWLTPDRNSRGRPIYLRKYIHGVAQGTTDTVNSAARTDLQTYAAKMIDGTLPGGFRVCGPQGAVASAPFVSPFVGYRQLKRRGRRPT